MNVPIVGQAVYLVDTNVRVGTDKTPFPVEVTKVGKKYFETNTYGRFFLDSWKQDGGKYTGSYQAYPSIQDCNNEMETRDLTRRISAYFSASRSNLSLEKVRAIIEIIEQ